MKKVAIISAVVLLIALSFGTWLVFFATYSEGYRVGTVIKMTHRGVVFKTYEGQLHTGGVSADVGEGASSIWDFSIRKDDSHIREQIEAAVDAGSRVKLYYDEKYYQWAYFGETKYFITKVERVNRAGNVDGTSEEDPAN